MGMIFISVKNYSRDDALAMPQWLWENFGPPRIDNWWFDYQPMIEDLVCREEIATMFILKWKKCDL
jgi:hypothetical protein